MAKSTDPDQSTDLDLQCLLIQGMSCSAREGLTLSTLSTFSRRHFEIFFSIFRENRFDISCKLSCMKCQILIFLRKIRKQKSLVCRLLNESGKRLM